VAPSDVGTVWLNEPDATDMTVAVVYPAQGLLVEYTKPALPDPLANFQRVASQSSSGEQEQVAYLNGQVPALTGAPNPALGGLGLVEFVVQGIDIRVMGPSLDVPSLQAFAESILAQATSGKVSPPSTG
jgi:hypothetical protein